MTREYSCREFSSTFFDSFSVSFLYYIKKAFSFTFSMSSMFRLAELRTISLCDSDLFLQNYNASRRKLSECSNSPAISFYSGTESQQSMSDRSTYDNVDASKVQSPRFLLPPSLVNRSKSFQEPPQCRKYLSPRSNITIRRNLTNSIDDRFELISNRSSVSPVGSTRSETLVDCSLIRPDGHSRKLVLTSDRKRSPFLKILRRVRKLSFHWPKCRSIHRG